MKKEEIVALIDEKIEALKAELDGGVTAQDAGPGNSGPPTPPPPPTTKPGF